MQLRVFEDEKGGLHLEISSPSLKYKRCLFVPMLPSVTPLLDQVDPNTLVDVLYGGNAYRVAYLLIHSEQTSLRNWRQLGEIEESDSRNVLNHILDILAWD